MMAPMATRMSSEIGGITQKQIDYYKERAKGGVGTIITGAVAVDYPLGAFSPKNLTIHHNSYIAGHNELVETVHAYGAKIICQLNHCGRQGSSFHGKQLVAPSAIPCKSSKMIPKELTINEIWEIVRYFVEAAIRAKKAGYDGIQLHGGHGYLIGQFISPYSNHRKDNYGGDLNKRMNFPLEIIQGIRKELGSDYPIHFRFSADEFVSGGVDLRDSKRVAQILENAGIQVLHITAGTHDSRSTIIEPMSYVQGWKIYLSESIKKVVRIPIAGVGTIKTPEFAEEILEKERVDFITLGRALLADPYWPEKARERRQKEIIPCISCNECIARTSLDLHIRCTVNPLTGREQMKDMLLPVGKRKKIMVIGGGPAGMEAALTASARGHQVVLYERNHDLGGQLKLAKIPPGKEPIGRFLDYLTTEIEKAGIKVKFGQPATHKTVVQGNPETVIIATGAIPLVTGLPGIEKQLVCSAWDILSKKRKIRNKVVLIAGGGTVGCETALYLISKNKKVILIEMLAEIALDMEPINRADLISKN